MLVHGRHPIAPPHRNGVFLKDSSRRDGGVKNRFGFCPDILLTIASFACLVIGVLSAFSAMVQLNSWCCRGKQVK